VIDVREIRHAHLFCGLGGGARGMNRGHARVGSMEARFRCVGGIDVDPAAIRDFDRLAGVRGTVLDLFDRAQYVAFHGKEPPAGWREATPDDVRRAFGYEHPHILFLSAPCKGFSGLLSESRSRSDKYQALNRLTLRGMYLALEAHRDDPIELIVFENVPRIANRGRPLLDQIVAMLQAFGYAVAETTHDCGELGGLAQSRKRFLLVARHVAKVPPFLYQPDKKPLRAVGDVLGRMPLPGDLRAGPMHKLPALQWKTWVRLAFVEAGGDWRTLKKLRVQDGVLQDFLLVPDMHAGVLGVTAWDQASGVITGNGRPATGKFSVADPRIDGHPKSVQHGVLGWQDTAGVVTGKMFVGGGPHAIADPRLEERAGRRFNNVYRVVRWNEASPAVTGGAPATSNAAAAIADPRCYGDGTMKNVLRVTPWSDYGGTVTGAHSPANGALCVADPRMNWKPGAHENKMRVEGWEGPAHAITGSDRVGSGALSIADPRPAWKRHGGNLKVVDWDETAPVVHQGGKGVQGGSLSVADRRTGALGVIDWNENAGTIAGESFPSNGAFSVADPRPACVKGEGDSYESGGHYGVVPWDRPANVVNANARWDNGFHNVADPRLPAGEERLVALIVAADGTWHRPFTTFELAGLQSLVDPEEQLELDGLSDSAWRERIGNAVPPEAAEAIAGVMGTTLLLAWSGETFLLSTSPIWVRQVAVALSVRPA
jgi:site-specific DNA-cytosine methylase